MKKYITNAPVAYDYDYTSSEAIHHKVGGDNVPGSRVPNSRYVTIPDEHATYQTDRYLSGMYLVLEVEDEWVDTEVGLLPTTDPALQPPEPINPFTTDGVQCVVVSSPTGIPTFILGKRAEKVRRDLEALVDELANYTSNIEVAYYGYDPIVRFDDGSFCGTDGYPDYVGKWDDDLEQIVWEQA